MLNLPASSPISSPSLRLELRRSAWLVAALSLMAALAAVAVLLSALPDAAVLPVAALLGLALWQLVRGPRGHLVLHPSGLAEWWPEGGDEATATELLALEPRGPVAVLSLRIGGRTVRWAAASDTLPPPARRLLRLWLARHRAISDPSPNPQGPA
jgi:toxin CptA